jgi:hypothetical protein
LQSHKGRKRADVTGGEADVSHAGPGRCLHVTAIPAIASRRTT